MGGRGRKPFFGKRPPPGVSSAPFSGEEVHENNAALKSTIIPVHADSNDDFMICELTGEHNTDNPPRNEGKGTFPKEDGHHARSAPKADLQQK